MDISIFFEPYKSFIRSEDPLNQVIGNSVFFIDKGEELDFKNTEIAIIGIMDDSAAINNSGCSNAPDEIRKYLYSLAKGSHKYKIADLGNIKKGATKEDTYFAVSSAISELIKNKIVVLILGGGQDFTYANYRAYEKVETTINIATIDPRFDLGEVDADLHSQSYLSKIILHQPNFLFNYANIGFQSHHADIKSIELMDKLFFDTLRLGQLREDISWAEPLIRNADIVSFDISAIRASDAHGNKNATPNGLFGEEACQLARYSGMSDKVSSFGIYEVNPEMDKRGHTSHLAAQISWYFIDGFYNRKKDTPIGTKKEHTMYRVNITEPGHEIIFFKSNKTDRWWMDVPYPPDKRLKFERHHLVPCSYKDYQQAMKNEMPDLWWKTFQKLS
jgi:formiminoglutamase